MPGALAQGGWCERHHRALQSSQAVLLKSMKGGFKSEGLQYVGGTGWIELRELDLNRPMTVLEVERILYGEPG